MARDRDEKARRAGHRRHGSRWYNNREYAVAALACVFRRPSRSLFLALRLLFASFADLRQSCTAPPVRGDFPVADRARIA